jgi:exodeoxyribonuclease VII large subunit
MHWRLRDAYQSQARRRNQQFRELHMRIQPLRETLAMSWQLCAQLTTRLQSGFTSSSVARRERVARLSEQLVLLNPTSVLQRGYSIVMDTEGKVIRGTEQLAVGQSVAVTLGSGNFRGKVQEITPQ